MKEKKDNLLRVNPWRIIRIFIILFFVFEIVFYLSFQGAISGNFWPLDKTFYYYTPCLAGASILFGALSITQTSYELTPHKLIHNKMGKTSEYFWSDIIYIDEEFSKKKKMLLFYTKDGREHYLAFDKEGLIFTTALEKCGSVAHQYGATFQETIAAIETFAPKVNDAGSAGIYPRNVLQNLEKTNDQELMPSVVGITKAFENLKERNISFLKKTEEIKYKMDRR